MRISYNWLKDYVDIKIRAEKLAGLLTMAGLPAESVEKSGDDYILELEVTANRPDWLSVIGVARELSALTGRKLKTPKIKLSNDKTIQQSNHPTIRVEDKRLCPRYTARVISGVNVGESPAWLKVLLETMGLRPVNNIVDITNFCLFETGEPMHAFDLDKIKDRRVIIRRAGRGEKITTIDGADRALDDSILIIADSTRPIAIAGVMGGVDTEVTSSTKNILLEAAYFDPIATRRASRKLRISTESSYRFERRVEIANIAYSSDRASGLILEMAGGNIGEFVDIGKTARPKKTLELAFGRLNKILGIDLPPSKVKNILTSLGMKIKSSSKEKLKLEIPGFRYDLNDEIDLVEEISRIYGYDKMPLTIPAIVEQPVKIPYEMAVEKKIRDLMASLGIDEIITYSLVSKKALEASGVYGGDTVGIRNPLTSEQEAMRPSLIPGMLGSMLWNMNRRNKDLKLFELGRIYLKENASFAEKRRVCIGIAGEARSNWLEGVRESSFFDLKGTVETLFSALGISNVSFKHDRSDSFSPAACASIEIGGIAVGVLGEARKKALDDFDIKEPVYLAEICVDSILKHARLEKKFEELPKYPSVSRDISIIVGRDSALTDLTAAIADAAGPILKYVKLIDRYSGRQIPDGKVGLTYRLEYQDMSKTLEEKEVSDVHARILRELEEKFGARLR